MKSLGKFTLRGWIKPTSNSGTYGENGDLQRLLLDDGDFATGFKITKFVVWNYEGTSTADCSAILATDKAGLENELLGNMDSENNMQIAWASSNAFTSNVRESNFNLIDRDNLIVQDLWIAGVNNSTSTGEYAKQTNYYIECEKFHVGLNIGAYAMVRNASQDIQN